MKDPKGASSCLVSFFLIVLASVSMETVCPLWLFA